MLLTGGGIAVYLLCRKKCQEDNDALIFSGLDPSTRRRPSSHGRRSRWGAQTWFGWLWDPVGETDNATSAVFESQVWNLQVFSIIKVVGQETNLQFQISFTWQIDKSLVKLKLITFSHIFTFKVNLPQTLPFHSSKACIVLSSTKTWIFPWNKSGQNPELNNKHTPDLPE